MVVSNHRSMLDILVLLARFGGHMLSRDDLGRWPVIRLARPLLRTLYIDRSSPTSGATLHPRMSDRLADATHRHRLRRGPRTPTTRVPPLPARRLRRHHPLGRRDPPGGPRVRGATTRSSSGPFSARPPRCSSAQTRVAVSVSHADPGRPAHLEGPRRGLPRARAGPRPPRAVDPVSEGPAPPKVSRRLAAAINFLFSHVNTALVVTQDPCSSCSSPMSRDLYGAWLATGNILVDQAGRPRHQQCGFSRARWPTPAARATARASPRSSGTGLSSASNHACLPLSSRGRSQGTSAVSSASPAARVLAAHAFHLGLAASAPHACVVRHHVGATGLQLAFRTGVVYTVSAVRGIASTVGVVHQGYGLASIPMGSLVRGARCSSRLTGSLVTHWCARYLPERPRFRPGRLHGLAGTRSFTPSSAASARRWRGAWTR